MMILNVTLIAILASAILVALVMEGRVKADDPLRVDCNIVSVGGKRLSFGGPILVKTGR